MRDNGKRLGVKATSKVGEQGVILVSFELLDRGFNPYRPIIDDHGVDLMLSTGVRIQVKAARLSKKISNNGTRVYVFSCSQNVLGRGGRALGLTQKRRTFSPDCDFVILVGLNQRRFWIIPSDVIDGYSDSSLVMSNRDDPPTTQRINELIEKGLSKVEIANEVGCCETTVWKRGKGFRERDSKVRQLRAYEDRWDLLDSWGQEPIGFIPPTVYELDPDFVGTLAGPIAA